MLAVFIGIMRVSARQQKAAAQMDAKIFRLALDLMEKHDSAMMVRLNMFGRVAYMNKVAKEHLELAIGDKVDSVIRAEFLPRHNESSREAMKSSEPKLKTMDCEILTKSGWRRVHMEAGAAREGAFAVMEFID